MFGLISKKRMIKDLQTKIKDCNKEYENSFKEGQENQNRDSFNYNLGECNILNWLINVYLK